MKAKKELDRLNAIKELEFALLNEIENDDGEADDDEDSD